MKIFFFQTGLTKFRLQGMTAGEWLKLLFFLRRHIKNRKDTQRRQHLNHRYLAVTVN